MTYTYTRYETVPDLLKYRNHVNAPGSFQAMIRDYQPIEKPKRIKDRAAIEAARLPWCESCGTRVHDPSPDVDHFRWSQIAHLKSRGSGGSDVAENLMCTCLHCHGESHQTGERLVRNYPKGNPPPGFYED